MNAALERTEIFNLCLKERDEENPYPKMRKRPLRDWPEDTLLWKKGGHSEALSNLKKMRQIKHVIEKPRECAQRANKIFGCAKIWRQTR